MVPLDAVILLVVAAALAAIVIGVLRARRGHAATQDAVVAVPRARGGRALFVCGRVGCGSVTRDGRRLQAQQLLAASPASADRGRGHPWLRGWALAVVARVPKD